MMESMYDYWPYYRSIPFERHDSDNYPRFDTNNNRRRPRPPMPPVRSVPVNFMPTRSDYAVKIQKAFRGFRIRKNVRKILELKRGVEEVEKDVMDGDTIELIIRDDRHRLKVSETLMALLLKLDSIGGLNDSVRICRKAVIRKAILLQERIDSIVADATATADDDKSERQLMSEIEENDNESEAWECVDDGKSESEDRKQGWLVVEEDNNNSKVVLEKMAEDNRRLMEMIADLCNKNDNQTRLIQTLSNRVDQLEQAMNDRLTRKRDNNMKKKKQMMMMLNNL
ncbi:uncharacterized protein LOC141637814 [Silene latifolia]|uniref:uncharacterized protein LOC141637814 n=1 Tax=Silene latifolia TaxID=37657 RepID=UPI003D76B1E9